MFCTSCAAANPAPARACAACGVALAPSRRQAARGGCRSGPHLATRWVALCLLSLPVAAIGLFGTLSALDRIARSSGTRAVVSTALADGDYAAALMAYEHSTDSGSELAAAALQRELARARTLVIQAPSAGDDPTSIAELSTALRRLPRHTELLALRGDLRDREIVAETAQYRASLAAGNWVAAEGALASLVALKPGEKGLASALATLRAEHSPLVLAHDRGLWLVPPTGGVGELLFSDVPVTRPVWSPDRSRIAFVSADPYDGRAAASLYSIAADGSDPRLLARSIHPNAVPSWSPDGRSLAVTSVARWDLRRETGILAVHLVDAETGANRPISIATGRHGTSPVWSPAGDALAFISRPRLSDPGRNPLSGPADVVLWSPVGGTTRNLTGGTVPDAMRVAWQPDGASLLVTTRARGLPGETSSPEATIVAIDPESGSQESVAVGIDASAALWAPAWSPDGQVLAWVDGPRTVVLRDETGARRRIDTARFLSGAITWSPAGDVLLAVAADPDAPSARIDPAATGPPVDVDIVYDGQWPTGIPQWSPVIGRLAGVEPAAAGVGLDRER